MQDAGYPLLEARGRTECPGLSGPVHPVPDTWNSGRDATPDPSSPGLEGADDQHISTPGSPDADSHGRTDAEIQKFLRKALRHGVSPQQHSDQGHPGGRDDSLSSMVPPTEMSPARSESGNFDGRDGPEALTTSCGAPGTHQFDPREHNRSDALENPAGHEKRPADV